MPKATPTAPTSHFSFLFALTAGTGKNLVGVELVLEWASIFTYMRVQSILQKFHIFVFMKEILRKCIFSGKKYIDRSWWTIRTRSSFSQFPIICSHESKYMGFLQNKWHSHIYILLTHFIIKLFENCILNPISQLFWLISSKFLLYKFGGYFSFFNY